MFAYSLIFRIHPAQRTVRERPIASVETTSLVDECYVVFFLSRSPPKSRLAPVGVARPFINYEDPRKCLRDFVNGPALP